MKTIEEEVFCINFELKILSGIVNNGQLERWVPGFCNPYTDNEHKKRYLWVSNFVKDLDVLDIACGVGAGSLTMIEKGGAKNVFACDIDEETIRYASIKNYHKNINYIIENAEKIKIDKKFDIVVSFETIEHLEKPIEYLESIKKILKKEGSLIISTPISKNGTNRNPANHYHKIEWGLYDFHKFIENYFRIEDIYVQIYNRKNILNKIIKKIFNNKKKRIIEDEMKPIICTNNKNIIKKANKKGGYQILICKMN